VHDLVHHHLAEVEARLRELRVLRSGLRRLAERAETTNPADCLPGSICTSSPTPDMAERPRPDPDDDDIAGRSERADR
jgi:hypothetical protein